MTEKKKDSFVYDEEEEATTIEQVLNGGVAVNENKNIQGSGLEESGFPEFNSMNFKGIVPGAGSAEASDDPNFLPVSDGTDLANIILTPEFILQVQSASSKRYLVDPIYQGILDAFKFFIVGQGIYVTPQDESEKVLEYLRQFEEENKMETRERDLVAKSLKAGEIFIRKFTKGKSGTNAKIPTVRFLNFWEITKIIKDPEDNEKVITYVRTFKNTKDEVDTEDIPAKEIIHIKFGALDDNRGLPPFTSIQKKCFEYNDWLFNRVVFNRLKTAFYLEEIISGTATDVTTVDNATPDADKTAKRGKLIKRMPKHGSKLTHNESVKYKWLSPDVKADDAKEDGRAIRLAICTGAQCPEFILGDSSQSNYASSLVAQNPFVRKIQWFQDFYEIYLKELYSWVIGYGIENGHLPKMSTETIMREKASAVGWFRKFRKIFNLEEQFDKAGNIVVSQPIKTKTGVDIQFPTLVATDILKDTTAYQIQQAMGVVSDETISKKLGYDFEEEKRKMEKEENEAGEEGDDEEIDDIPKLQPGEDDDDEDEDNPGNPKNKKKKKTTGSGGGA